ncbi:heat shock cognate 70 kDa protein-like protein [Tanacetum coccineum]
MDGSKNDSPAIGIDLGTTYSCVAVWKNDRIQIIPNDQGNRTTPSTVAFVDDERLIGDGAKNQAAINPHNTIFDAKRLIGRKFSDSIVQADMKFCPFRIKLPNRNLVKSSEDAVLNVPAYFNDHNVKQQRMPGNADKLITHVSMSLQQLANAYWSRQQDTEVGNFLRQRAMKEYRTLMRVLPMETACYGSKLIGNTDKKGPRFLAIDVTFFRCPGTKCFEIDANGILTVTAEILSTGKTEKLIIMNVNGRLSKEEIEKMVKDAEKYKLEDQEFKKKVNAYIALEDCVYDMKNKINDYNIKERLHPESLKKIENAISETTQWLHDNETAPVNVLQTKKLRLELVCKPLF